MNFATYQHDGTTRTFLSRTSSSAAFTTRAASPRPPHFGSVAVWSGGYRPGQPQAVHQPCRRGQTGHEKERQETE